MTFVKNLLVMLVALAFGFTLAHFMEWSRSALVDGLTFGLIVVAFALLLEDLMRKIVKERDLFTWEYVVGVVFVFVSLASFTWAAKSVTNQEMITRLGITTFLCFVSGMWFYLPYKHSIEDSDAYEKRAWERAKKKLAKVKTTEAAEKIYAKTIRYRMDNDLPLGELDFDNPLAKVGENFLTYDELQASGATDTADAYAYIQHLAGSLDFTTVEETPVAEAVITGN